jgi:hypothetical protein
VTKTRAKTNRLVNSTYNNFIVTNWPSKANKRCAAGPDGPLGPPQPAKAPCSLQQPPLTTFSPLRPPAASCGPLRPRAATSDPSWHLLTARLPLVPHGPSQPTAVLSSYSSWLPMAPPPLAPPPVMPFEVPQVDTRGSSAKRN